MVVLMSFIKKICLLVFLGLNFTSGKVLLFVSTNNYIIDESSNVTIECFANSTNIEFFNVTWLYENGEEVTRNVTPQIDYQENGLCNNNSTESRALLYVFGNDIFDGNMNYEKTFNCTADNGSFETVHIQVNVPLSVERDQSTRDYSCLHESYRASCRIQSYPNPENVFWLGGNESTLIDTTIYDNGSITSNLYVFDVTEEKNFTCFASNVDRWNMTSTENTTFNLVLRNDNLSGGVSHKNTDDVTCTVNWETLGMPDYVTGYQINYTIGGDDILVSVPGRNTSSYSWKLTPDSIFFNLRVAVEMGRCIGPFKKSIGSCSYTNNPDNTAIIAVSASLGGVIIILLLVGAVFWWRMKPKTNQPSSSDKKRKKYEDEKEHVPMPPVRNQNTTTPQFQHQSRPPFTIDNRPPLPSPANRNARSLPLSNIQPYQNSPSLPPPNSPKREELNQESVYEAVIAPSSDIYHDTAAPQHSPDEVYWNEDAIPRTRY